MASDLLSFAQIADKAAKASALRFAFAFVALAIVAIAFIAFGTTTVKVLGLHLLVVDVASVFASYVGTPVVWTALKECKNK